MSDAPEKIWVDTDEAPYFDNPDRGRPVTEYTRTDLVPRWEHVAILHSEDGPLAVENAQYPDPGDPVLVWVKSAYGEEYVVHTIMEGRGNWSWPSFGLAWQHITPPEEDND